jgi:hypothetical protein
MIIDKHHPIHRFLDFMDLSQLVIPPQLPLTGLAIYSDGTLLLQGGDQRLYCICKANDLSADAYKQMLCLLEVALGLQRNDLATTDPSSFQSLLRMMMHLLRGLASDPIPRAIVSVGIRPLLPPPFPQNAQPSGGGICQPVVGELPGTAVSARACSADLGCLGPLPAATRPQKP